MIINYIVVDIINHVGIDGSEGAGHSVHFVQICICTVILGAPLVLAGDDFLRPYLSS